MDFQKKLDFLFSWWFNPECKKYGSKERCPMKSSKRCFRVFLVLAVVGLVVLPLAAIAAEQQPIAKSVYALMAGDLPPMTSNSAFWQGARFFPEITERIPVPMFYYLIKTDKQNILVDCGISPQSAAERKTANYSPPDVMLGKLGLKVSDIDTIILTHGHWDHADALEVFPKATIYIQRNCYRWMVEGGPEFPLFRKYGYPPKKMSFAMLTLMWDGRLKLVDGDAELFPGIKVIEIGGHHQGLQSIVIETKDKPIILTSDSVYSYANLEKDHPIGLLQGDLVDVVKGVERMRALNGVLVPSHDPKVLERFKPVDKNIVQLYP
jgi:glyoxylase-like metal-dependent hydrolase (beta-lactamase superfamily II)